MLRVACFSSSNVLELSSVSLSEIAIKTALGKLHVSAAVARQAVEDMGIRILPYTGDHGLHLFSLPLHHRDPFDRQIIAQAISEAIPVVTPDEKSPLQRIKTPVVISHFQVLNQHEFPTLVRL